MTPTEKLKAAIEAYERMPASISLHAYKAHANVVIDAAREVVATPIPMILHCPRCGLQHIDGLDPRDPAWTNPVHRSHTCRPADGGCGHIWRPADVPTEGVRAIETRGSKDSPIVAREVVAQPDGAAIVAEIERERDAWSKRWAYEVEHSPANVAFIAGASGRMDQLETLLAFCRTPSDRGEAKEQAPPMSFEDVCNVVITETAKPTYRDLIRWSQRYPQYATKLADFFATWAVQEYAPEEPAKEQGGGGEAKIQAGEWYDDDDGVPGRDYPGRHSDHAAWVNEAGWAAHGPAGVLGRIASGPETGDLGQCLADLCLVAHGYLAWERVFWGKDREASGRTLNAATLAIPGFERENLTPATLEAVLAAVRSAK